MPPGSSLRYYLKSLTLVLRVILFEKLSLVWAWGWWLTALLGAWIAGYAALWAFVAVLAAALLLYRPLQRYVLGRRHWLVRCGDRVEYALPDEGVQPQQFASGRVLRSLTPEHAAKTEQFDAEELALYEYFFLVEDGKRNRLIPAEWIIAIEAGELEV